MYDFVRGLPKEHPIYLDYVDELDLFYDLLNGEVTIDDINYLEV